MPLNAVIAGIGETDQYPRGRSERSVHDLAVDALVRACEDGGVSPSQIDGLCTFGDEQSNPVDLANSLGMHCIRWSTQSWGGGGGGVCAAIEQASVAVTTGRAELVAIVRALTQPAGHRYGEARYAGSVDERGALSSAYGLLSPAHQIALMCQRFFHEHELDGELMMNVALATYGHAKRNPLALMSHRPLTKDKYCESRWIAEPFRLYDCCLETEGAAAVLVAAKPRADAGRQSRIDVRAVASGFGESVRQTFAAPTAHHAPLARRLFDDAGIGPADVDVLQCYDNFTGAVVMSLVEYGFVTPGSASEVLTVANLSAPSGLLPINTAGGQLAGSYIHGLGLVTEAVRQLRGDSCNQVPNARISMVIGGPATAPVSSCILAREE